VKKRISTSEERTMIMMTRAQPVLRTAPRRDAESGNNNSSNSNLDAAHLSVTLRELAMRAHQLVRATDPARTGPGPMAADLERELTEVHLQIVQLERSLDAQDVGNNLATYVSALRQRVAERLS
jgi:hypothetical protein